MKIDCIALFNSLVNQWQTPKRRELKIILRFPTRMTEKAVMP